MIDFGVWSAPYTTMSLGRAALVVVACGLLAGCSNNASSLLSAPQTIQTGQIPAKSPAAPAAAKTCVTSAAAANPIGVAAMLEQAKVTAETKVDAAKPSNTEISKADSDCLAARVKAQVIATSGQAAIAPADKEATGPVLPSKGSDLTLDFDGDTAPISPKDKRAIADMLAKKGKSTSQVRILAGRGGRGNMFDQAVVAQRRANSVRDLLPTGMVVSVEFDPLQVDDTVRVEFVDKT